jgi:hypothetical protein
LAFGPVWEVKPFIMELIALVAKVQVKEIGLFYRCHKDVRMLPQIMMQRRRARSWMPDNKQIGFLHVIISFLS